MPLSHALPCVLLVIHAPYELSLAMLSFFNMCTYRWLLIRPFCIMLFIDIYCIMGCYYTLCHNTYGYSLLFYKVYHEEGECQQLEFWLEKEQTLETYSAQLQKS